MIYRRLVQRSSFFILFTIFDLLGNNLSGSDLVVFSCNRPLQLEAHMRSLFTYVTGLAQVIIIYRADKEFEESYDKISRKYAQCTFIKQSAVNFRMDFKVQVLKSVFETKSSYIIFAVDDIIVTDSINLGYCVDMLEKTRAYGFYLRLGKNIVESYMEKKYSGLPKLEPITPHIFMWQFGTGQGEWRYAHTVDMTLYRKADIKNDLAFLNYYDPNGLEGLWALRVDLQKCGLCFDHSKIVNLPLNLVRDYSDPSSYYLDDTKVQDFTPHRLLEKFNQGYILDINPLHKLSNSAPHINYVPSFIKEK